MSSGQVTRRSYEESCRLLQRLGYPDAGAEGVIPPIPDHRPQCGDEAPLGVSFFRTRVGAGEHDLENLTLPRTFFGRSEVGPISFKNTDLSESTLCWNDFTDVDFTDCILAGSDLRASLFVRVKFVRANLKDADLRRSDYEDCDFTDAEMKGAKLVYSQKSKLRLSEKQSQDVDWQSDEGDEPEGG